MRTIKYRGQDINTKEWRYGNLLHNDDTFYIVPQNTDFGSDYYNNLTVSDNHEVIPETVGQFTGLLDKNGKEIYEGDLVTCHPNGCVHTVEFIMEMGGTYGGGMPGFNLSGLRINSGHGYAWTGLEVITGTIHDKTEQR